MCVIEDGDVFTNDDGTASACCNCGWTVTRPTFDAADAAASEHIERFEESERRYAAGLPDWDDLPDPIH